MGALYNGGLLVALGISAGTVLAVGLRSERYDVRQGGTIELNPALSFDIIGNLTTCESATIRWFYAGPPGDMSLSVTNIGVAQVSLPPAPSSTSTSSSTSTRPPFENSRDRRAPGPFVDMVISDAVNPSSLSFRWSAVNIASGSYKFEASMATEDFLQESPIFHVLTGRNTACLQVGSPSTSATTSDTSTSSATGTGVPPSQSSGSWVPGGSEGESKNPINVGSIVGIVLGVLAMTIIGVGAYFVVRNRRRKELIGGGVGKKWNHLNSTDSRGGLIAAVTTAAPKGVSRRLSASHRRVNNSNGSSSLGHTTKSSQDDIAEKEMGSPGYSSRKNSVASYDSQAMALSNLPSLHLRGPDQSYDEDDMSSPKRRKGSYPDPTLGGGAVRRSSSDARSRSRPYLPTIESTNNSASGTPEGTSFSHNTYEMQSPSAPNTMNFEGKRENRQSFGRKRKPVPAYNLESESPPIPDSPSPSPMPSSPTSATPLDSRSYHSHEPGYLHQPQPHSPHSPTPGSSVGHYSTRGVGSGVSRPVTSDGSELLHKSSLGLDGKPVHYLMPDLPADQR